jgi:hypothetical protein
LFEPSDLFANLWHFDGTVARRTYALVGFIGFAVKHNVDRFIANVYSYPPTGPGVVNY